MSGPQSLGQGKAHGLGSEQPNLADESGGYGHRYYGRGKEPREKTAEEPVSGAWEDGLLESQGQKGVSFGNGRTRTLTVRSDAYGGKLPAEHPGKRVEFMR